ncbi:hypothetical protein PS726_00148 [Pseudomonas fluorescens]|uniref:hypothetical protein n=1 Tax=Pseudomonas fluorescens TaxID=294 RepID=UPI001240FF2E|nr:hypothetical protein [Pseudomonas fluorescens]VVN66844.1 hypothetical protein PS726_00148 [Pseudomonas fluorescens]
MQYLNLDRRFVQRTKYDQEELLKAEIRDRKLSWDDVLAKRFAIVVAPANFGKTTELKELANRERQTGKHAVFVELRKVLDRNSLEEALHPSEVTAFETWQQVSSAPITLLIDSLDEASPTQRQDLNHALRKVRQAFNWPNSNARWLISTRPAVLSLDVMGQLSTILGVPIEVTGTEDDDLTGLLDEHAERATINRSTTQEPLVIFSMAPLTSRQAVTYLQSKHSVSAAPTLLEVARKRGLPGFTESPGGLDVIAHLDLVSRPPESLTDVFRRVVQAVENQQSGDHRLTDAGPPSAQVEVVRRIAAASLVCQLQNVEMPLGQLTADETVLSAKLIAGSLLQESALTQLLNSQLFIDAGHHQVKPYPEELIPFLAAQHFASLVHSPEDAKRLVNAFSWHAPTGEQGVHRRLLAMLGWLATLSNYCRTELLQQDPQVVAFFGDLRNSDIPRSDAHEAIRRSIHSVSTQGDRIGRNFFRLTPENYWQVGADSNLPLISELFEHYGSNLRVRSALLDIATHSQSDILRQQVLKACQGDYALLLQQRMDLYYLLGLGVDEDLTGLAEALTTQRDLNEERVSISITHLAWTHLKVSQIVTLIEWQFSGSQGGYRIASTISGPVFDAANDLQAYRLTRSLVIRLARIGRTPGRKTPVYVDIPNRKLDLVIDVLASLITRSATVYESRVALLCLIIRRFFRNTFCGSTDLSRMRKALQKNSPLRLAVLRKILTLEPDDDQLRGALFGLGRICTPTLEDATTLESDRLRETIQTVEATNSTAMLSRPPAKIKRQSRLGIDKPTLANLHKEIEQIRDGSARHSIALLAGWLLQDHSTSRYGEVSFDPVREAGGADLAEAFKAGVTRLWREQLPMFKEDEPRSFYHITAAGLQGLHHELRDGSSLPAMSTAEVIQAIQYAVFEINGYPHWFWPLVEAHQDVAISEFQQLVGRAGMGAVSYEHAEELLISLNETPERIRRELAPAAWTFLTTHPVNRNHTVESILRQVTNVSGTTTQNQFETQAWDRIQAAFGSGALEGSADAEFTNDFLEPQQRSAAWGAYWLIGYPDSFTYHLEQWLTEDKSQAQAFVLELAAYFGQDFGSKLIGLAKTSDHGVDALAALYKCTLEVVPPEDDAPRPSGVVYTPGRRDHAQQLRDALIPAIAAAESTRAYEVLDAIRKGAASNHAQYLSSVLFDMQEARFTRPPLAQRDFDQFDRDFKPAVNGTLSLALAVQEDLLAVKYSIEKGEFSLRRFFSAIKFSRIDTDKEGLALEADFQALLGSEMNHLAGSRYTVTREPETAEATRRDVLCRKGTDYASIELKMSMRWTVSQYLESLEYQLVGQYMRNRNATTGFLVIVLQKDKTWKDPTSKKRIKFSRLLELLQAKAIELERQNRRHFIRVIGIDATPPKSFRDA